MVQYRRDYTPGATYFFTVTLKNRNSSLLTYHINLLTNAFRQTKIHAPYKTHAMVILPEHLHVIWELPSHDSNYSLRWRLIKTYFSKALLQSDSESPIWQRRFWEHRIRNDDDFISHVNYIHYNPVKHNLVKEASAWQYSSIHRYIRQGILPRNWGNEIDYQGNFGEA